jgi:hypothetical protein
LIVFLGMSSQDSNSPRGLWSPGRAQSPHSVWPLDDVVRSGCPQAALSEAGRVLADHYGPRHREMFPSPVSSEQVSQDERRVLRRRKEQAARRRAASALGPVIASDQQLVLRPCGQQQVQQEQQQQQHSDIALSAPEGCEAGTGASSSGPEERITSELLRVQRDGSSKLACDFLMKVKKESEAFQKVVRDWEVDLPFGDDRLPRPHVTKAEERAVSRAEQAVAHGQDLIFQANKVLRNHRLAIESHCLIPPSQRGELGEVAPDPRLGEVRFLKGSGPDGHRGSEFTEDA